MITGLIGTVVVWIDRLCSIQLQHNNDNLIYHSLTDDVEHALKNVRTKLLYYYQIKIKRNLSIFVKPQSKRNQINNVTCPEYYTLSQDTQQRFRTLWS